MISLNFFDMLPSNEFVDYRSLMGLSYYFKYILL